VCVYKHVIIHFRWVLRVSTRKNVENLGSHEQRLHVGEIENNGSDEFSTGRINITEGVNLIPEGGKLAWNLSFDRNFYF
jgi:hypothetical protein